MGGAVFGNMYVFFVWRGKSGVSEHDQIELALIMGVVSLLGTILFVFLVDIESEEIGQAEEEKSPVAILKAAFNVLSLPHVQLMLPVIFPPLLGDR